METAMSALKLVEPCSDAQPMAKNPTCSVCAGDLMLSGNEEKGEEVYCPTCQSPCVVSVDDEGDTEVESDF